MGSYRGAYIGSVVPLQALCESITDCHHSTPVYQSDGKLVIRNFNIKNGRMLLEKSSFTDEVHFIQRTSRAQPKNGDLIITREAPMGEVCIIPEGVECCLGQRLVLIKPDSDKVDNKFLLYALLSEYTQIQIGKSKGTGSIVSNLRIPLLKELLIPDISLMIQKKIGAILATVDKKIELNNKINTELEAMAKLIYDYWFVQFDFPDANGKPYKSSGGKMIYNEALKREIPEGWGVGDFGEYAKVKSGFAFKSSWWESEGVPVVKIKDIQENNSLNQSSFSFVSEERIELAKRFKSKVNDVVIAMTGATIGKFAIIPKTSKPLLINQRVGLYDLGDVPIKKLPFLINSMKQEFFRSKIFQLAGGAAQPNISGEQLGAIPLISPNTQLIEEYNKSMLCSYKKHSNNTSENQRLVELRDWLLPMLMNGQATVKNT